MRFKYVTHRCYLVIIGGSLYVEVSVSYDSECGVMTLGFSSAQLYRRRIFTSQNNKISFTWFDFLLHELEPVQLRFYQVNGA